MTKQDTAPPRPLTAEEMRMASGGNSGTLIPIKIKHNV